MNKNNIDPWDRPELLGADKALRRAALRAREIARQTQTPLVVERDGQVVEVMIREDGREVECEE